jgi:hypothetical protein
MIMNAQNDSQVIGITLGTAIAVACSWTRNRSILWAILHGTLTWFYVIYFALTRRPDEVK